MKADLTYEDICKNLRTHGFDRLSLSIADKHEVTHREMWAVNKLPPAVAARREFWATIYKPRVWTYPRIASLSGHHHTAVLAGRRAHLALALAKTTITPDHIREAIAASEKCA